MAGQASRAPGAVAAEGEEHCNVPYFILVPRFAFFFPFFSLKPSAFFLVHRSL
jgi:hypothetical protein